MVTSGDLKALVMLMQQGKPMQARSEEAAAIQAGDEIIRLAEQIKTERQELAEFIGRNIPE